MTLWGALAGGAVGTIVLTSTLRLAQELGWTRMDIPLLLGTIFTDRRGPASVLGYAIHFSNGLVFALAGSLHIVAFATICLAIPRIEPLALGPGGIHEDQGDPYPGRRVAR